MSECEQPRTRAGLLRRPGPIYLTESAASPSSNFQSGKTLHLIGCPQRYDHLSNVTNPYNDLPTYSFVRPPEMDDHRPQHPVVIVGGGPLGLTVAAGISR